MTENISQPAYEPAVQKNKRKIWFRVAGAVVLLMTLPIAWSNLTNSGYTANVTAIEADIRNEYATQRQLFVEVDCPSEIDWKVGATFHCVVTHNGESARAEVTMENDKGDITWWVN